MAFINCPELGHGLGIAAGKFYNPERFCGLEREIQ